MEQTSLEDNISNLLTETGALCAAIKSEVKEDIEHCCTSVLKCALAMVNECGLKPKQGRNLDNPQVVFIEPESMHAFIKLQSSVSAYITACYLNDIIMTQHALYNIEYYLGFLGTYYSFKTNPV